MKYKYIVFDFDGTVCETGEGIFKSAQFALQSYSIPCPNWEELGFFVGPPLLDSFQRYDGVDEKLAEKLVEKYRERYGEIGIYESSFYNGIIDVIKQLKSKGCKIAIGSSKPQIFIEKILDKHNLLKYFDYISAVDFNNARKSKTEIISAALKNMGCTDKEKALMVGDRYFDIDGADGAEIDSVGVLYGYGNEEEFKQHGATYIIEKATDLLDIIG